MTNEKQRKAWKRPEVLRMRASDATQGTFAPNNDMQTAMMMMAS